MSFSALGVDGRIVEVLSEKNIVDPTPVQRLAIPALASGSSAMVVARTGSGKTLAYVVPLVERVSAWEAERGPVLLRGRPRAVVITSTRELVTQTSRVIKGLSHRPKLRVRALAGGMSASETAKALAAPLDVAVGNPARIASLCSEGAEPVLRLDDVGFFVVDEADTLLAPGTRPEVEALLARLAPGAQIVFMSATLPEPIRHFVLQRPEQPLLLLSKDAHAAPERVTVRTLDVPRRGRVDALEPQRLDAMDDALTQLQGRGIVFVNRRESAEALGSALRERRHDVVVMEGAMLPHERRKVFREFCAGSPRVLVTTELGGRGIDVDDLRFIVNYELPSRLSEYLHRVGRVGRAGRDGEVINLVGPEDAAMQKEIQRLAAGGRLDTGEALRSPHKRTAPSLQGPRKVGGKDAGKGARKPAGKDARKPARKPGPREAEREAAKARPDDGKPRKELPKEVGKGRKNVKREGGRGAPRRGRR